MLIALLFFDIWVLLAVASGTNCFLLTQALQCNRSRGFMECHGLPVGTGTFAGLGRPWRSVGAWTGSVTPHGRQLPWAESPAVTHRVPPLPRSRLQATRLGVCKKQE